MGNARQTPEVLFSIEKPLEIPGEAGAFEGLATKKAL